MHYPIGFEYCEWSGHNFHVQRLAVSGCVCLCLSRTKLRLAGLVGLVGRPGDLGPRRWLPDVTMGFSEILRKKKHTSGKEK